MLGGLLMGRLHRMILWFVLGVVRFPRVTLAVTLVTVAGSLLLAWGRLSISTDQNKLFNDRVPFFRDFVAYDANFPENDATYVIVRARGDEGAIPVARWGAAADAIAARLRGMPGVVRSVDHKAPVEEMGAQGVLFEEAGKLREEVEGVRELAQLMKVVGERPNVLTGLLGATPVERLFGALGVKGADERTARFVRLVAESLTQTVKGTEAGGVGLDEGRALDSWRVWRADKNVRPTRGIGFRGGGPTPGGSSGADKDVYPTGGRGECLTHRGEVLLASIGNPQFAIGNAPSIPQSQIADRKSQIVLPDLAALDAADPSRLGYYYVSDELERSRHVLLVHVQAIGNEAELTALSESVGAIRSAVREVAAGYPEFVVGVTGRPALSADEMGTTDEDSRKAEAVALTAVFVGVMVLLRSFWLAVASELALGVGIAWTLAWATVTRGELNLLSIVFFLALIGIGMDYLVQILSRYGAEAGRRGSSAAVWVAVFRQVGPPINTACVGAAGAFLVSMLTDFEGAADLGLIAGGGLLLCLLAGYTFLPALLTVWPGKGNATAKARRREGEGSADGRGSTRVREGESDRRSSASIRGFRFFSPAVWLALLAVAVPFALRTKFNPSLLDLQAQSLESVQLVRRLQTWNVVVLSKDLEAVRAARAAVMKSPRVARTESVLDAWDNYSLLTKEVEPLPEVAWAEPVRVTEGGVETLGGRVRALARMYGGGVATTQATLGVNGANGAAATSMGVVGAERVAAAEALGRLAGALETAAAAGDAAGAAARLSAWQVGFLGQLKEMLAAFRPGAPDFSKAPAVLRDHLIGRDGAYALYVYPKEDLWDQAKLDGFVVDVEARVKGLARPVTLTGIAHNIHHSTESIRGSFYKATGYALGLIVLLVWIDLRRVGHTLLAVSVLGLGLPMLVGLMGLLGVDWNFANFFGLPILIGAGHEYGVFLVHRYREARAEPVKRAWGRWDVADRALLLCAFVTSSSFGFFWVFARHRGLKSMGLVMALGSLCIYLAGVVALRPVLKWRLGRGGKR